MSRGDPDLARCGVSTGWIAGRRDQLRRETVGKDAVREVRRRVRSSRRVYAACVYRVVDRLGKRDLRHLDGTAVDLHLDVNVRRASLIPAGIDRREMHLPAGIGRLDAAEVGL